jgi:hypothetical protein
MIKRRTSFFIGIIGGMVFLAVIFTYLEAALSSSGTLERRDFTEHAYYGSDTVEAFCRVLGDNVKVIDDQNLNINLRKEDNQLGPVYQVSITAEDLAEFVDKQIILKTEYENEEILFTIILVHDADKYEASLHFYDSYKNLYPDSIANKVDSIERECRCYVHYREEWEFP